MISIEFLIMLIVVTIGLINTSEKYSVDFIFIAASALNYLYFFLALPVYKILRLERIEFRKFLKILTFLCAGSYVIRGAISLYYVATGVDILPAIALEGAAVGWIRNGVLRINPPCLGLIYLPITFYLYSTAEKLKQRVLYVGMIVLGVWYMTYITQARSMMIYQICILILLLMLKNKPNSRKGIIGTALLICVVVYLINSPAAEKLIASFSASNTETGASTVARFNAISYFGMQFLQKPLSGIGLLLGRDTRTPIDEPVVINFADTIVMDPITDICGDAVFYQEDYMSETWTYFDEESGKITHIYDKEAINEEIKKKLFVGVFKITNTHDFRECLRDAVQKKNKKMNSFYHALELYSQKHPMQAVLTHNWFDIGHEDKYYNSKLEVRAREFNHITIDKNRGILKKTSDDKDKFIGEIKWYLKLPADVEYVRPRIFDYSTSYVNPYVSMEYYAYHTVHELFLYGDLTLQQWVDIFNRIRFVCDDFKRYTVKDASMNIRLFLI